MERKNIYDVLKSGGVDIEKEYGRIFDIFHFKNVEIDYCNYTSISNFIRENFDKLNKNLVKRCLSLDDFNETYNFYFEISPSSFDINYLVSFCEYVINLIFALPEKNIKKFKFVVEHIESCMADVGYAGVIKDGIAIYVKKNEAAFAVAEISDDKISYSLLEYNHFKLKGNLIAKKNILKNLADDIEPQRKVLASINKALEDDLFFLLNNFIRHNNENKYYMVSLSDDEKEQFYDDAYQMYLCARLLLERSEMKERIETAKRVLKGK